MSAVDGRPDGLGDGGVVVCVAMLAGSFRSHFSGSVSGVNGRALGIMSSFGMPSYWLVVVAVVVL